MLGKQEIKNSNISDYGSSFTSGIANSTPENKYTNISPISSKGVFFILKAKKNNKWYTLKGINDAYKNITLYETILQREFEIGVQLSHKNISSTLYIDEVPNYGKVIVMEYIDGCTLSSYLKNAHRKPEINKIIGEIFDAVEYMHQRQILHRDLKPDNIMITYNGGNVKIIDLGLCDEDSCDVLKQSVGTNKYASPEQLAGKTPLDCRTDIYSLGKILKDIFPNPDRKTKKIIKKCIETDKNKRPANIYELREIWNKKDYSTYILGTALLLVLGCLAALLYNSTEKQNESVLIPTKQNETIINEEIENRRQESESKRVNNRSDEQTKTETEKASSVYTHESKKANNIDGYLEQVKEEYLKTNKQFTDNKIQTFEEGQREVLRFSVNSAKIMSEYKNKYGITSEMSIIEFVIAEYITKLQAKQEKLPMLQNEIRLLREKIFSMEASVNNDYIDEAERVKDVEQLNDLKIKEAELCTKLSIILNEMNNISKK